MGIPALWPACGASAPEVTTSSGKGGLNVMGICDANLRMIGEFNSSIKQELELLRWEANQDEDMSFSSHFCGPLMKGRIWLPGNIAGNSASYVRLPEITFHRVGQHLFHQRC